MKHRWIYAGAVAAMLAAAPLSVHAQDATAAPAAPAPAPDPTAPAAPPAVPTPDATPAPAPTPDASTTPPATTPDTTMGTATGGSMSMGSGSKSKGGMMLSTATPDYSLLSDPHYDYIDLQKAKANGLKDNEIASLFILSEKTGYPLTELTAKTLRGETLAMQAQECGVPIATVLDTADTKDKIEAYKAAYEQTGTFAVKNMAMSSPMPMDTTPAATPAAPAATMAPTKDIVATAMSDKRFSTLVKELKKADLVSTLQGTGPFTVFAPTNAAFKKLPKGELKKLEKDPATLKQVLTYHVISGAKIDAATAMAMTSPTSPATVEGQTLQVTTADGKVKINDATVVAADIQASNGIIHAIDTVLLPTDLPATPSPDTTSTTGSASSTSTGSGTSTGAGSVSTDSTSTSGTSGTASPGTTGAAGTDSSASGTAAPGTGTAAPTTTPTPPAGPDSTAPAAGTPSK